MSSELAGPRLARRRSRPASTARAAVATTALAAALAAVVPAVASAALTPGPQDPNTGFPAFYQDSADGAMLQPCTANALMCLATRPNVGAPLAVPSNFPSGGEAFFWAADPEFTGALAGNSKSRFAIESAFLNGVARPGEQMMFSRIRMRFSGLVPGAPYRITHPYGVQTETANAAGVVNVTDDQGCLAAGCSTSTGALGRVTTVLRWAGGTAPAGFIGDPTVAHAVEGSPTATNRVVVQRADTGAVVDQTTQFLVQGQLSPGTVPAAVPFTDLSASELRFADRTAGTAPEVQKVVMTNTGVAPLSFQAAVTPNPADFPTTGSCMTGTLAPRSSCEFLVGFASGAPLGPRAGTLAVQSNSANAPAVNVALNGGVANLGAPPAGAASARQLRIGTLSLRKRVRLATARTGVRVAVRLPAGTRSLKLTLLRRGQLVRSIVIKRNGGLHFLKVKVSRRGTYKLILTPVGLGTGVRKETTFKVV